MNTVTKAIAILTLTLLTSACATRQDRINQENAYRNMQSEKTIQNIIRMDSTARFGCDPMFADCRIVTGRN